MRSTRRRSSFVPIQNGLWVIGGIDNEDNETRTTEIIFMNGTIAAGPLLPQFGAFGYLGQFEHCAVGNKDTIFYFTGIPEIVSIFRVTTDGIIYIGDGPNLTYAGHFNPKSCGIFYSAVHDGRPLLVISSISGSEYWDYTKPGSKWLTTSKTHTEDGAVTTTGNDDGLIMSIFEKLYIFQCE